MGGGAADSSNIALPTTNFTPVMIGSSLGVAGDVGNAGINQSAQATATGGSFGLSMGFPLMQLWGNGQVINQSASAESKGMSLDLTPSGLMGAMGVPAIPQAPGAFGLPQAPGAFGLMNLDTYHSESLDKSQNSQSAGSSQNNRDTSGSEDSTSNTTSTTTYTPSKWDEAKLRSLPKNKQAKLLKKYNNGSQQEKDDLEAQYGKNQGGNQNNNNDAQTGFVGTPDQIAELLNLNSQLAHPYNIKGLMSLESFHSESLDKSQNSNSSGSSSNNSNTSGSSDTTSTTTSTTTRTPSKWGSILSGLLGGGDDNQGQQQQQQPMVGMNSNTYTPQAQAPMVEMNSNTYTPQAQQAPMVGMNSNTYTPQAQSPMLGVNSNTYSPMMNLNGAKQAIVGTPEQIQQLVNLNSQLGNPYKVKGAYLI